MEQLYCEHPRTKIIARDEGVDYVECLDCRKVFEAEDLEPLATESEEDEPVRRGKLNRL